PGAGEAARSPGGVTHTPHNAPQLGTIVAHLNPFDCASHAWSCGPQAGRAAGRRRSTRSGRRRRGFSLSRFRVDANSERASYFLANRWAIGELAMTKILANVIGVGGVAMIALGLWGFYVLMVGELRLREYILAIQTIAVGFVLIGLAQGLRLLLALVALQPGH